MIKTNLYFVKCCAIIIFVSIWIRSYSNNQNAIINTEQIIKDIQLLPSWISPQIPINEHNRINLKSSSVFLSKFSSEEIRKAYIVYIEQWENRFLLSEEWGKLYIANRLLFEVPEISNNKVHYNFGGWFKLQLPENLRSRNLLWPLKKENGVLELGYQFGGYFGGHYDPVSEFDYFQSHFKRRTY